MKFSDIEAGNVSPADIEAIRRTGVAVIKGVVDKDVTERLLSDVRKYLTSRPFQGFPSASKEKVSIPVDIRKSETKLEKVIYESYWSPSQVKARSHPNMLATQSWMNQLYTAHPDQKSMCQ